MKYLTCLLIACAVLSGGALAQQPASPEALLKAAMQREQVDGDAAGALADYKVIVERHPKVSCRRDGTRKDGRHLRSSR